MSEQAEIVLALIAQAVVFTAGIVYKHKLVSGSNAKAHNLKTLINLFCFAGISVTAIAVFVVFKNSGIQGFQQTIVTTWVGMCVVGLVLGVITLTRNCPSCKRLNARKETAKTIVGQQTTYRVVTREVPVRKPFQILPEIFPSKVSVKEHVPMLKTTYRHEHQCNYCNHRWSTFSSQETEQ